MQAHSFSPDLKSLTAGALLAGGLLVLVNFKPADKPTEPAGQNRRYQAVTGEKGTVILDTQTGKFITYPHALGRVQWEKGDFETIQASAASR